MFRKAFSISPTNGIFLSLNRSKILKMVGAKAGPENRQSFKLRLLQVALDEASGTIRN